MAIITGRITQDSPAYHGPGIEYHSDNSSVSANDEVFVRWREGEWYYIDYPISSSAVVGSTGEYEGVFFGYAKRKCMYVPCNIVTNISGTVPIYTNVYESDDTTLTTIDTSLFLGPSGAYSTCTEIETIPADTNVYEMNNIPMQNGFKFIAYYTSGARSRRGWVPVSALDIYNPPSCIYEERTINGANIKVMRANAGDITLTDLGYSFRFEDSRFHGINGAFFGKGSKSQPEIYQITANNGIPIEKGFHSSCDGGANAMGRACLTWTGSSLVFNATGISNISDLTTESVWSQGGINLQLGLSIDDIGIDGNGTVEDDLRTWLYETDYDIANNENNEHLYSAARTRTVIAADLNSGTVYLIVCTSGRTISALRSILNTYFGISENGILNTGKIAMLIDGGSSTSMRNSNTNTYAADDSITNKRFHHPCIVVV